MTVKVLYLRKESMGSPVEQNVGLDGQYTGAPAITVVAVLEPAKRWCLIADAPGNSGVSATNGYEEYASKVCELLEVAPGRLQWYELDSTGAFDRVVLEGDIADFSPILAPETSPRSYEAFVAEVGGLPVAAKEVVRSLVAAFEPQD